MSDPDGHDPLKALGERLNEARQRRRPDPSVGRPAEDRGLIGLALGMGSRIGLELVVAVGFGVGVGWLVDRSLGTRPWGILIFLVLGIAAGGLNVYRAIKGLGMVGGYVKPIASKDRAP